MQIYNMKRETQWIWFVLVLLFITHTISALDKPVAREMINNKPGFISIDCGSEIDYLDSESGMWYESDNGYVERGSNHMVSWNVDLNFRYFGKQLNTLRCFPEGERNCYSLKPKEEQTKNSSKYLIRALFSYGNYDGINQAPCFDLYIGVNLAHKVNLSGYENGYWNAEIIHTAPSASTQTIDVCLVRSGPTIPCIASLELRPLNTSIYQTPPTDPQQLLILQLRIDVGTPPLPPPYDSDSFFRYKDDVYDRTWRHNLDGMKDWYSLDMKSVNFDNGSSDYKLPSQVLRTAVQTRNVSKPLQFDFDNVFFEPLDKPFEYFIYFHFAEIEQLPRGQKRVIDITLEFEPILSHPLVLEYLKPVTVSPQKTTRGFVSFNITATSESDAPPILNAFEIYKLITQLDSPTHTADVGAIVDIKSTYQISRLNWQGDPCVPKQYAWEGLICSFSATIPRITSLNLSSSKLMGQINMSFSHLTELEFLDLSLNELEGPLSEFLAELPNLKLLNVTGNKLSGKVPKALKEKADLQLSVDDNPDLCMDSCNKKNFVTPLVASLSALIVILFIALGFWIIKRRQKVMLSDSKKGESLTSKYRAFSYSEILNITENLKTVIGEGGFGKVYFGILQDNTQVAVKLLSSSSAQGYKEFRSEAQLLMIVHHRNLVSLIGYCDEGENKALIYEYMANGSLHQHLSVNNPNFLKWNERLIIAVDAARGLDYLHNGCKPPLIHRDLKPSNILLDQNMHSKIADFGLCRAFRSDTDSHISTLPAGTLGYVDPEFQRTGNSNKKSDIYSFGIILFELITGQHALSRTPEKNVHILEWVIPMVETGDVHNIVDPRLKEEFNINSAWKAVEIALSCISPATAERPDISQILAELKECLSLDIVQRHVKRTKTIFEFTSLRIDSEISPSAR
ncbi:probable leucine-rich repeat receptor-like protein kinase At2g28990 isoform X2 [Cajanus cajan]|uniref:probable leucine-rich repeat receptor-like protein kinase At2g28990 isoform X2 n=1 Tax=Cajanus cajan TaxID=3821 RepID=UPI0010FBA96A|nr:probable leucine-rich repeat receptor-like protein kinase At2g28990 isoform X2 [Cajanus cajan]